MAGAGLDRVNRRISTGRVFTPATSRNQTGPFEIVMDSEKTPPPAHSNALQRRLAQGFAAYWGMRLPGTGRAPKAREATPAVGENLPRRFIGVTWRGGQAVAFFFCSNEIATMALAGLCFSR